MNPGKIIRRFETRSLPHSLAATLRGFTFCVAGATSSIRRFARIRGRARSPLRADEWTATECRPYQDQSVEIEAMGIWES